MSLLELFLNHPQVSTDSRKIKEGDLFFALKGENFNGNLFAESAISQGASYAIIDEDHGFQNLEKVVKVNDVLTSLQELAREYRRYLNIPVLALTGSNGKTTTKELLASVLNHKYNLNYTKGNLNNEIGVPLTILSTKKEHQFLIIEMGANHQGEIYSLCHIAEPDYGLITNIGYAHLEGFGGYEGVKKGKGEMYNWLSKNDKSIFVNTDDKTLLSLLPKSQNIITYNNKEIEILESSPYLHCKYQGINFGTNLAGDYNINNISCALHIGEYFDVNIKDAIKAISDYTPTNNRSQRIAIAGVEIIMDAYNANPSSMQSSLTSFLKDHIENKIVILGDMRELGEYASVEHQIILEQLNHFNLHEVILVGPEFYKLKINSNYKHYENVEQLKMYFDLNNYVGKEILVKGSRGIALESLFL